LPFTPKYGKVQLMNNPIFNPAPLLPLVLQQRTWQPAHFLALTYNNTIWGYVHHDLAHSLIAANFLTDQGTWVNHPTSTDNFETTLEDAVSHLIAAGLLNADTYAPEDRDYVTINFCNTQPPAKLARHYASSFGLVIKGVATFLYNEHGIWLSQRGPHVYYPNVLEHSSGGLITFGAKIVETAQNELADELILPRDLYKKLRAYSRVTMCFQPSARRLTRLLNYHFKLLVPADIMPQASEAPDVETLVYLSHTEIYNKILATPQAFTPYAINSITDFWYHHGFFNADHAATHQLHQALYTPLETS
jgi:hypothetical protein